MIENRELYSFDETDETAPPEHLEAETELENVETGPPKLLFQSVVATLCLVITISLCRYEQGWTYWVRERLHHALNTSSQSTFGLLWDSAFIQNIVRNGNNLIRLEKVTQTLSQQEVAPVGGGLVFEDSVWPIPGNIIKEYGVSHQNGPFDSGVIMETTDQARVMAVAAGTVFQINKTTGGWRVELNHGSGWNSVYQPIAQVQIQPGQSLKAGQIIGRIGIFENDGKGKLFFEIKHNGQPVDPRSVIR